MRLLVTASLLLMTSLAAAQAPGIVVPLGPAPAAVEPAAPVTTVSYRRQIAIADALSIGAMVVGPMLTEDASLVAAGLSSYVVTAPLIHLLHGRSAAAGKSLALRLALPVATGYLAAALAPASTVCAGADIDVDGGHAHGCSDQGAAMYAVGGFLVGGLAAMYLDGRYLARYERATAPTWSAAVTPTRGGASLGISGTF